ncbi:MAG TPA: hypothetical protein VGK54_07875 [Chloroflexota bacterium]|jgi:hypothetical protein
MPAVKPVLDPFSHAATAAVLSRQMPGLDQTITVGLAAFVVLNQYTK